MRKQIFSTFYNNAYDIFVFCWAKLFVYLIVGVLNKDV